MGFENDYIQEEIDYQIQLGLVHRQNGNLPQALRCYEEALNLAEKFGYKKAVSRCYGTIGAIHYELGNFPIAINYFEKRS